MDRKVNIYGEFWWNIAIKSLEIVSKVKNVQKSVKNK